MEMYNLNNENAYSELKKISVYKNENALRKVLELLKNCNATYVVSKIEDDKVKYHFVSSSNLSNLKCRLGNDMLAVTEVNIGYSGIKIKYIKNINVPVGLKRKITINELVGD